MRLLALAFVGVATLTGAAASTAQEKAPLPISSASDVFAIIDNYDERGQTLQISMVNAVMSRDASTILFPGDTISAVIDPLKPGLTRQAVCVTEIQGKQGHGRVIPFRPAFPREGCLAQLHDYEGRAGLPATDIRVGLPVRVWLNGDLLLEGRKR